MKKVRFLVMLVITLSLILAACGGGTTPAEPAAPTEEPAAPTEEPAAPTEEPAADTPQYGGSVTILVKQLPPEIGNIKTTFGGGTTGYIFPAVEPLVGVSPDEGLVPTKLATGWEIAEDGTSLTFTLREGVKFHDDTDFNAEAVKWNLEESMKSSAGLKNVESVEVVDDYTVKLNLSSPDSTILNSLSWLDGVQISPASVVGQTDEYVATHLVGTGPFVFEEFQVDTKLVYVKNDNYWDEGKPYIDDMTFLVVADQNTAETAFLSGQANVWAYLDARNAPALKEQGFKVNTCPGLGRILLPDSKNESSPFAKKEVRWAVEYAIDKQAIADAFGYGTWSKAVGPCAYVHEGCDAADANEREYNPEKARELLAAAGYADGFEMTVYSVRSIDDEMLTAIQAYLADVGIVAEMIKPDSATMASLRGEGWENGLMLRGLTTDDPNYFSALSIDGPSETKDFSTYVPGEYFERLAAGSATMDPDMRLKLSREMVLYLQEEAIFIPLIVASRNAAYYPEVHIDFDAFSVHFWNPGNTWIEQ